MTQNIDDHNIMSDEDDLIYTDTENKNCSNNNNNFSKEFNNLFNIFSTLFMMIFKLLKEVFKFILKVPIIVKNIVDDNNNQIKNNIDSDICDSKSAFDKNLVKNKKKFITKNTDNSEINKILGMSDNIDIKPENNINKVNKKTNDTFTIKHKKNVNNKINELYKQDRVCPFNFKISEEPESYSDKICEIFKMNLEH